MSVAERDKTNKKGWPAAPTSEMLTLKPVTASNESEGEPAHWAERRGMKRVIVYFSMTAGLWLLLLGNSVDGMRTT